MLLWEGCFTVPASHPRSHEPEVLMSSSNQIFASSSVKRGGLKLLALGIVVEAKPDKNAKNLVVLTYPGLETKLRNLGYLCHSTSSSTHLKAKLATWN